MNKHFVFIVICLFVLLLFSGCVRRESADPLYIEKSGFLEEGYSGNHSCWARYNNMYGVFMMSWKNPCPILNDLQEGEYYTFICLFYMNRDLDEMKFGPYLVEIRDEFNNTIWSE